MCIRDLLKPRDVACPPPKVDAENPRRTRCDQLRHASRVDVVRDWIDVAEYRREPLPKQRVRRANERKRWDDHLAGQTGCPNRQLKAVIPLKTTTQCSTPMNFAKTAFNFAEIWAVVG